jgi:hypothetical protein
MRRWLLVSIALAAGQATALTPARAGILSVSGDAQQIAAPSSVVTGATESADFVRVFRERQNFTLPADLEVDFAAPGLYDQPKDIPSPSPVLVAGTRVDSYFFHADPPTGKSSYVFDGSVTFTTDILGVIIFNNGTNGRLGDTDALLGHPSTLYPLGGGNDDRDLEFQDGSDDVTLSADRRTLTFHFVTAPGPMDQIRVITAESFDVSAVPEPASLSLAILGLLVGAGVEWRHRCRAASTRETEQPGDSNR